MGMVARLRPEKCADYLALHQDVWPEVQQMMSECGIRNYTIFRMGDVIFSYLEYVGTDFKADQAKMSSHPKMIEWWSQTEPCQLPFRQGSGLPNWETLDEVFHLR